MRFIFATPNLALPNELAEKYAGVEISGVVTTYSDLVNSVRSAVERDREIPDIAVISDSIETAADRALGFDLAGTLSALRAARAGIRLIVVSRSATENEAVKRFGASLFVEHDPKRSAANLAELLDLAAKTDVARIIAVAGLQGGAGRTTVAQAIAQGLAETAERSGARGGVLLWEMDLLHPTIGFDQDIDVVSAHHGQRTFARLINGAPIKGDEDMPTIRESILMKDVTRLDYDLLLAPQGLREVLAVFQAYPSLLDLRERIAMTLQVLSRHYQAIVCDLGTNVVGDPANAVVLPAASAVAVVATPCAAGLSSVAGMRVILGDLRAESKSRLVINRIRRSDTDYTGFLQRAAEGAMETTALINEGAPAANFTALGPKLAAIGG
jgi:Flp pilus assembly CpaE family ATPase